MEKMAAVSQAQLPLSSHSLNAHQLKSRESSETQNIDSWQRRRHSCILYACSVVHALA